MCNLARIYELIYFQFQGRWFEIGAYYSESSENLCSRANYALEGGVVQVLNSQVINQTLFTISGTATVASTDGSARLSVVLEVGNGKPCFQRVVFLTFKSFLHG